MPALSRAIKMSVLVLAGTMMLGWPTGHTMAQSANTPRVESVGYPWAGTDDEIAINLAIGSLRDSLIKWLTTERGVHAETLIVATGAIAGFAAINAVRERVNNRDVPVPAGFNKSMPDDEFYNYLRESGLILMAAAKTDGAHYFFGDLINGYLIEQSTTVNHSLFAILSAAAMQAGVKPSDLPDMKPIFHRVSSVVGKGGDYGVLDLPKGLEPQLTPREALDKFWPRVKFIFERTDGQGVVEPAIGRNVKPEYWPFVTALVARQILLMTKDTVRPRDALALMMESAIWMSKVDPKTVPQDRPANAPPQPPKK
jgi:hypothetical protein